MFVLLKRVVWWLVRALIALCLVFSIYSAYGFHAERSASRRAAAMCASILPGSDASVLSERARSDGASDMGLRWTSNRGVETLFITYVGLPPFSRHLCIVTAEHGRVLAARQGHLD